jgi:hypothetical protein
MMKLSLVVLRFGQGAWAMFDWFEDLQFTIN